MGLRVFKFGGTSVGGADAIRTVADTIEAASRAHDLVVVVSAMEGVTRALLAAARAAEDRDLTSALAIAESLRVRHAGVADELLDGDAAARYRKLLTRRTAELYGLLFEAWTDGRTSPSRLDAVLGFGELMSAPLVAAVLGARGLPSGSVDGATVVVTDDAFGSARPQLEPTRERVRASLGPLVARGHVPVVAGFLGATAAGVRTTLGFDGSDLTASILGVALDAERVVFHKDVEGILSADPRHVPDARVVTDLTHDEAAELVAVGPPVLHAASLEPLARAGIAAEVRSTFVSGGTSTLIGAAAPALGAGPKAVAARVETRTDAVLATLVGVGRGAETAVSDRAIAVLAAAGASTRGAGFGAGLGSVRLLVEGCDVATALHALHALVERDEPPVEPATVEEPRPVFTTVVVGGGFSGSLVAANLLRRVGNLPIRIVLVERRAETASGVAYSTRCASHVLNVRAKNMSAFREDPDDFVAWARQLEPEVTGDEYLPRRWYGEYLRRVLADATAASVNAVFEVRSGEAVDVEPRRGGDSHVVLDSGERLRADCVVLALGNFTPAVPEAIERGIGLSSKLVRSPWHFEELSTFDRDDSVLLLGTGLTMADTVLALRDLGHRGPLHAVSRRGILPIAHGPAVAPLRFPLDGLLVTNARHVVKRVRAAAAAAERNGADWRASFDGLRPMTQSLWRSLPFDERRRFLRHASRYWDVHRHRVAPEVAETIDGLVRTGRLRSYAARVVRCEDHGPSVDVTIRERATGAERRLDVSRVVNCTGPDADFRRIGDPLVVALRSRGLIDPHPLGLGVRVTESGRLIERDWSASRPHYAIGALRKGLLWESTAVPELREQAAELAREIARLAARVLEPV